MRLTLACIALLGGAAGVKGNGLSRPFEHLRRQASAVSNTSSLTVDLGYGIYEGVQNSTSGLNVWKGIRFAAPPTGALRWQAPQPPTVDRSNVIQANSFGAACPQTPPTVPDRWGTYGDEDCLFLNVYAPQNKTNLPVFVWIHGGGYGGGDGTTDMTNIIKNNAGSFVGVVIQYRLGAFGFLASDEVFRNGVVNAGLLDQTFALQWVQSYIHLFGGNASQVTIGGESAGGGSVMLQAMAYGGSLGDSLFQNIFAASPYLPMQYGYRDWVPSQSYYAFAAEAGCPPTTRYGGNSSETIFQCLVEKDTKILQNASFAVSLNGIYGTWGFLPVTDGVFVQQLPTEQLLRKQVNGKRILVGNNAQEGISFVTRDIRTVDDLVAWLKLTFPLFTNDDIARVLLYYPSTNDTVDANAVLYATSGYTGATAINQSELATGQAQRAYNVYAETTFVCPSYWLAEAFSDKGRESYRYQYSVVPALHGLDFPAYFDMPSDVIGPDLALAFGQIVGNLVTTNNPSIDTNVANGAASGGEAQGENPASNWPPYKLYAPYQINLNQSGGTPSTSASYGPNITIHVEPGLRNNFTLVNAFTWEGGRGTRCDFWRSVGALVPE